MVCGVGFPVGARPPRVSVRFCHHVTGLSNAGCVMLCLWELKSFTLQQSAKTYEELSER